MDMIIDGGDDTAAAPPSDTPPADTAPATDGVSEAPATPEGTEGAAA